GPGLHRTPKPRPQPHLLPSLALARPLHRRRPPSTEERQPAVRSPPRTPLPPRPSAEILAPSDMEALFGSNSHVGHKTADLTTLIVAQAALEVQRSLVAMIISVHNEIFTSGGDQDFINRILGKSKNETVPENKDDGESDDDNDDEGNDEDAENQEEEEEEVVVTRNRMMMGTRRMMTTMILQPMVKEGVTTTMMAERRKMRTTTMKMETMTMRKMRRKKRKRRMTMTSPNHLPRRENDRWPSDRLHAGNGALFTLRSSLLFSG
ncbi:hypothetical protein U9M48_025447, partial [Paspalum notatum var. saurae]